MFDRSHDLNRKKPKTQMACSFGYWKKGQYLTIIKVQNVTYWFLEIIRKYNYYRSYDISTYIDTYYVVVFLLFVISDSQKKKLNSFSFPLSFRDFSF